MNRPSTTPRILLLAGRRTPSSLGQPQIQRYRLARIAPDARRGVTASRFDDPKRS